MTSEITARSTALVMPRPTSLLVPDLRNAVPIVDTSSYSPFPTFPGSKHARDPFGLNAYLAHPPECVWSYVNPTPAAGEDYTNVRSDSLDLNWSRTLGRQKSIPKHRSLSMLRRPSPLGSQLPVSSGEEVRASSPDLRRRSDSLDSGERRSIEQAQDEAVTEFGSDARPRTPRFFGKKSFQRALLFKRQKTVEPKRTDEPIPPVPSISDLMSASMTVGDDVDPSTPMSSRSNSNYSTLSSASSTSSSKGIKTPNEGVMMDVRMAGVKLADALAEAGEKSQKGKSWRGWLGGIRGVKIAFQDELRQDAEPSTLASTRSSKPSATNDLLSTPKLSLTPSPSIDSPPTRTTSLIFPSDLLQQYHMASEQLRRISSRKVLQLRQPSPHPLAMSLRRQQFNLPDEVAFSLPSGQNVFPTSVNPIQSPGSGLNPAQGGLRLSIAIKILTTKLDEGHCPPDDFMAKKEPAPIIIRRPKGVMDFIDRPPFEERMIVYYAEGMFSPISMARPYQGVWDLDFSKYILALAEVDEPAAAWPNIPRPSIGMDINDVEVVVLATKAHHRGEEGHTESRQSDDPPQSLAVTPAAPSSPIEEMPHLRTCHIFLPECSRRGQYLGQQLRRGERGKESDEEPLTKIMQKQASLLPLQQTRCEIKQAAPLAPVHSRSRSQPADAPIPSRSSREAEARWKEVQQKTALEEVARARQRREASRSGETERRAMAELRKIFATTNARIVAKRTSTADFSDATARHRRLPSDTTSRRTSASAWRRMPTHRPRLDSSAGTESSS